MAKAESIRTKMILRLLDIVCLLRSEQELEDSEHAYALSARLPYNSAADAELLSVRVDVFEEDRAQTRIRMREQCGHGKVVTSASAGKASSLRHFVGRCEPQDAGGEGEAERD